jgi:hypothetical protein
MKMSFVVGFSEQFSAASKRSAGTSRGVLADA